ncbi:MAG TPA: hypothetical protein PLO78_02645 [Candidatus Omnitrophota bacterium]|nr:hypothetical protein [Candidatus Omnitrophota bacterium]
MKSPKYFLNYFLPGLAFIGCAFWAGTLQEAIFALVGFLSFFVVGVTVIVEGWKQMKSCGKQSAAREEK